MHNITSSVLFDAIMIERCQTHCVVRNEVLNSHDGVDVTGIVDVLDGVGLNPSARRQTLGVPQAAARCKHTNNPIINYAFIIKHN